MLGNESSDRKPCKDIYNERNFKQNFYLQMGKVKIENYLWSNLYEHNTKKLPDLTNNKVIRMLMLYIERVNSFSYTVHT